MKIKKKIILSCLVLSGSLPTVALGNQVPRFNGVIVSEANNNRKPDTLHVAWTQPGLPLNYGRKIKQVYTDEYGHFEFELPAYDQPAKCEIYVRNNGRSQLINHYYFESSDDVRIEFFRIDGMIKSAKYFGKGADKYRIIEPLKSLETELFDAVSRLKLTNSDNFESKLELYTKCVDSLVNIKQSLLQTSAVGDRLKKLIKYEFGQIFTEWGFRLYVSYTSLFKTDPAIQQIIRASFNKNQERFRYEFNPDIYLCSRYLRNLSVRESYEMFFKTADSIDFEDQLNNLKSKYHGKAGELLVSNLLINFAGPISATRFEPLAIDSMIINASGYIKDKAIRDVFDKRLKLTKGVGLFQAIFYDQDGNAISTESLKGKVVLIDLWDIHCGACARFHNSFHKNVYPSLKNRNDFIYLSVGTDRKKENWIKGIVGEKFTSKEYLNVSTGEEGLDHPFAKYYNIRSLPFMLLVDKKGNIYTRVIGDGANKDLAVIEKALSEKL